MGADLKYGISSNLTLDATVNPDFGQVEADPGARSTSPRSRPSSTSGARSSSRARASFSSATTGRALLLAPHRPRAAARRPRRPTPMPTSQGVAHPRRRQSSPAGSPTASRSACLARSRSACRPASTDDRAGARLRRAARDRATFAAARARWASWPRRCIARSTRATEPFLRRDALHGGSRRTAPLSRDGRYSDARVQSRSDVRGTTGSLSARSATAFTSTSARTMTSRGLTLTRSPGMALVASAEQSVWPRRVSASYQRLTQATRPTTSASSHAPTCSHFNATLRFVPSKPVGSWRNPFARLLYVPSSSRQRASQ